MVTLLVTALAVAGCSTGGQSSTSSASSPYATATANSPASSPASSLLPAPLACGGPELSRMSLRHKLAQMVVVGVTGTDEASSIVRREQIGGIFVGSWTDKSILTSGAAKRISGSAPIPLMVTVDQEGGRVARLSSLGIDNPSARQMAKTETPEQVRALAAATGRKLKNLGVTVDFAPVVDVSNESDDEVIGDRSFSNDPRVVTTYAGAYAAGLSSAGIMPVYKHFPGHGHGSGDSHTGVVSTPPLASLQTSDLVPYRTLLARPNGAGVMVGHLIVPGLTGPQMPASLSPRAIGMLRTGRGYDGPPFNGVVFSDDLSSMAAISSKYPIEQAALMSLRAGADIALWITTDRVTAVLDNLERAVKSGSLNQAQVDRSVVRILRAKGVLKC